MIAVTAKEISNPVAPIITPTPVAVKVIPELTPKIPEIIPVIIEIPFLVFNDLYSFLFFPSSINLLTTPS